MWTRAGLQGKRGRWLRAVAACVGLALLVGCAAPPAARTSEPSRAGDVRAAAPKTVRIAALREPVQGLAPPGGTQHGDRTTIAYVFHAGLTMYDADGNLHPFIAEKIPTLDDGDWKVAPDGQMELTWRLRPDVRWHDGAPLIADDFVFGIQVVQNPEVPLFRGLGIQGLSEVVALDDHTLLARWKQPNFEANVSGPMDMGAYPRRLLGSLYEGHDMQAFMNSPYWTSEFVGLGPYKLNQWLLGSYTEAVAFDGFFLGRPKIDRVIFRYISDLNTMVSNLLAGEIDVIPNIIKIEEVTTIQSAWEPRGGGTTILNFSHVEALRIQFRYPNAPWARDARVRRALVHMTDRQSLADTLLHGQTKVPDLFVSTQDPAYQILERRGFPKYPFDVRAGERLLADAGWTPGPDGFVNAAGERFTIELRVVANSTYNTNMGLAIADQWKAARLNPTMLVITNELPTRQREELKATPNGVFWQPDPLESRVLERFTTARSSTEQSLWRGDNYGAYSNPTFDQMFERYMSTLPTAQRHELHADMLKLLADDVPFIPLLYGPNNSMAFRAGLRGPTGLPPAQLATTWNIYAWDID
jgi:peptide/nickel transport system substrate-binding protein